MDCTKLHCRQKLTSDRQIEEEMEEGRDTQIEFKENERNSFTNEYLLTDINNMKRIENILMFCFFAVNFACFIMLLCTNSHYCL